MCGIVGVYKKKSNDAVQEVLAGLKKLEYRGYDSAGVAVIGEQGFISEKALGKIDVLQSKIQPTKMSGHICIGHTRWATHGSPSLKNAHPIITKYVAVVHNGIIENYDELKQSANLQQKTDTDTEIICRLLDQEYEKTNSIKQSVFNVVNKLRGAFALLIIFKNQPNTLVGVKYNVPLVFGLSRNEFCVSSDTMAFPEACNGLIYLDDGDIVIIENNEYVFYNQNKIINKEVQKYSSNALIFDKCGYKHFMLKEMFEQPAVIANTISTYIHAPAHNICMLSKYKHILIIACGSSLYAAMVAKYWFEEYIAVHTDIEIASEFTYRKPVISDGTLVIAVSQSGETADTINAIRYLKGRGSTILALVNVKDSTISRMADYTLMTVAGPEIGVASTKAFTAQLALLIILVIWSIKDQELKHLLITELEKVPGLLKQMLERKDMIQTFAEEFFVHCENTLFIARGSLYPIALEGALKLKEISYIHAEGYAAGELKHGPIALIDEKMPVVVLANSQDQIFEKLHSNVENVLSRKGHVFILTDVEHYSKGDNIHALIMPKISVFTAPLVYIVPLQLLAYYTAYEKGTDIDQPRNLAKSVTVE